MENTKSVEMSESEVLSELGSVLPERQLMRHRRHNLIQGNSGAVANNGSVANSNSTTQIGIGNSNTSTQSGTVINVL